MPRPLREQVVVITGASSGIGRETALHLGQRGASLVLAARNAEALTSLAREIEQVGGQAHVVPTDVADWPQVEKLAQAAVDRFGRIDTWINNAGLYLAARVEDMTIDDATRLMQVNVLGTIHGTKAALPHLIRQGQGTIINVGSAVGARGTPLLAAYSASKFAVKGFTEALRVELARDHPGIKVVLIMPLSINTPLFTNHARSRLGFVPHPIPPIYEPGAVADTILFAIEHPRAEIYIGPGRPLAILNAAMPGLLDRLMLVRDLVFRAQHTDQADDGRDTFDAPMPTETYTTTGQFTAKAKPTSLYTRVLEHHPATRLALMGAALVAGWSLARRLGR